MIVDTHTMMWDSLEALGADAAGLLRARWPQPWRRPIASAAAHEEATEPADVVFVLGMVSRHLGASITATQVARFVEHGPDRLLGFASIDPAAGDIARQIDEARGLGMVGLTVSPAVQHFHPADADVQPIYQLCVERHLPLIVQSGAVWSPRAKLALAQPMFFDDVVARYPDLRLVIADMGWPFVDQTLALLSKHRHVYAGLAGVIDKPRRLYDTLIAAHEQGVTDRLLLGSGFPLASTAQAIAAINSVNARARGGMPVLPPPILDALIHRDTLTLLGLWSPMRSLLRHATAHHPVAPVPSPQETA
ncbi:MAG: amidohydrolase family protein [Phycisphaeraceae bacterium]